MKLSIIIPVYNEQMTVEKLLNIISRVDYGMPFEVVVVNDGSTDRTEEKIRNAMKHIKKIRLISYRENRGKGFAIRKGFDSSSGDIVLIQDADLEYDPGQIPSLLKPIVEGEADVVFGSRFLGRMENISPVFLIGNKILTLATNIAFFSGLTDMETCYKTISRKVLRGVRLESDRFEIEAELTCKILRDGWKIVELPISYTARTKKGGKKINVMDGVKTLGTILKVRFGLI